ncbi:hypothetical protein OIV83_002731 [Microbotryomycetes sp. JL201]|nr:hypothetical protein OIV83_002731 [Microbotryomycetes sp. JL201]
MHFVKKYSINVSPEELAEPDLNAYRTFNEFFHRRLHPLARSLAEPGNDAVISSPADCRMVVYDNVDLARRLWIKGRHFTLKGLLIDSTRAEYFRGGSIVVARLAPADYHRFHSPVDADLIGSVPVSGSLLTVNPVVVNNKQFDVFTSNKRVVTYLRATRTGEMVAFVQVGALLVGSIEQTVQPGQPVHRGQELGYFAYGGSTIVIVFRQGQVKFDQDLLCNSLESIETKIEVKDRIGSFL